MKFGGFPDVPSCIAAEPKCGDYCRVWSQESFKEQFTSGDAHLYYRWQCVSHMDPFSADPVKVFHDSGTKEILYPTLPSKHTMEPQGKTEFFIPLSRSEIENIKRLGAALSWAGMVGGAWITVQYIAGCSLEFLMLRHCPVILIEPPVWPRSVPNTKQCTIQTAAAQGRIRCSLIDEALLRCST
ncbi:MAG: hypothetical protein V1798_00170 [Pseudomonadota bacterium]